MFTRRKPPQDGGDEGLHGFRVLRGAAIGKRYVEGAKALGLCLGEQVGNAEAFQFVVFHEADESRNAVIPAKAAEIRLQVPGLPAAHASPGSEAQGQPAWVIWNFQNVEGEGGHAQPSSFANHSGCRFHFRKPATPMRKPKALKPQARPSIHLR